MCCLEDWVVKNVNGIKVIGNGIVFGMPHRPRMHKILIDIIKRGGTRMAPGDTGGRVTYEIAYETGHVITRYHKKHRPMKYYGYRSQICMQLAWK